MVAILLRSWSRLELSVTLGHLEGPEVRPLLYPVHFTHSKRLNLGYPILQYEQTPYAAGR